MRILDSLTNFQGIRLRSKLERREFGAALLDYHRDVVQSLAAVGEFDGSHGVRIAGVADAGVDGGGGGVAVREAEGAALGLEVGLGGSLWWRGRGGRGGGEGGW